MKETLRIIRNIFFKTLLFSLFFAIVFAGVYYGGRGYWEGLIVNHWALIDRESLNLVVVSFFTQVRFYIIFILLCPALAMHCTIKCMECKEKNAS